MEKQDNKETLDQLASAVYVKSVDKLEDGVPVTGYDFNKGLDYEALFKTMVHTGFQATALGQAIDTVNSMIKWRLSDEPIGEDEKEPFTDPKVRADTRCTIFLGYTSNMASCGMREYIRYLCQHGMVTAIVTTCGAIEEDIMKLLADHYIGDFALDGKTLRNQGLNRIGNLIVPNNNYAHFEKWFLPLVQEMHKEQKEKNHFFTPSEIIMRMGKKLDDENHPRKEESIYYWTYKNNIQVFCPAITDGALGDVMYFDSYREDGFICDIVRDLRKINDIAMKAKKSG
jgi:deoxyhypusine synthase